MFRSLILRPALARLGRFTGANSSTPEFRWKRTPMNPFIPAAMGTWLASGAGSPDVLPVGDKYLIYYHGQVDRHGRIGTGPSHPNV